MEEIFVPALGMAMEQATLVDWLKQPGDAVEVGEPIAEIETDKSTLELSATTAGRLGEHRAAAGEQVAVGATVTVVLGEGEDEGATGGGPTASPAPPAAAGETSASPAPADPVEAAPVPPPNGRAPHTQSPRQRRLAALAKTAAGAPAAARATDTSAVRDSIGRLVSRSWTEIPHFAVARDVNADGVLDRLSTEPAAAGDGVRVSVTDVLVRALGRALAGRGSSDVGLAVATPYGVLLPVLPAVAERPLAEIAQLRRAAVERARNRRSNEADTRLPLMTVSNLGTHGVSWFTGIIPFGQQGLLTLGTLEQRPVVRNGRLSVGWQLSAVLNVDHRVWDGAEAAELLTTFAQQITSYGSYDDDQ